MSEELKHLDVLPFGDNLWVKQSDYDILEEECNVFRKQLEIARREMQGAIYTFGQMHFSPERDTMIYRILENALAEIEKIGGEN